MFCPNRPATESATGLVLCGVTLSVLLSTTSSVYSLPAPSAKSAAGSSLKYDQSQSGDYNVQVHLKNIEVYAILDDSSFGNEHYDYDYSELTLKPPAEGAVSTSEGFGGTSASAPVAGALSAKPSLNKDEENTTTAQEVAESTEVTTPSLSTSTQATTRTTRRCGAGYYRDHFGRCRRVRHPQLPILNLSHLSRKTSGKTEEETGRQTASSNAAATTPK